MYIHLSIAMMHLISLTRMSPGNPPLVAAVAPLAAALLTVSMGPAVAVPRVAAPTGF